MAATKSGSSLVSSQSSSAGSAVNAITGTLDLSTSYGGVINARVTNGGTGPTVGCTVEVDISDDNSTWRPMYQVVAPKTNSGVYDYIFRLGIEIGYARIGFGGNTVQAVTVEARGNKVTAI